VSSSSSVKAGVCRPYGTRYFPSHSQDLRPRLDRWRPSDSGESAVESGSARLNRKPRSQEYRDSSRKSGDQNDKVATFNVCKHLIRMQTGAAEGVLCGRFSFADDLRLPLFICDERICFPLFADRGERSVPGNHDYLIRQCHQRSV
jgi:hypothetical protein